jgi:hypothetical protein
MRKDPQQGEESWQAMEDGDRQKLIHLLALDNSVGNDDPALAMKILAEAKADPACDGWRNGLARLSVMDPGAAARIVEQAAPDESRKRLVETVFRNWSTDDLNAATAWRERMLPEQP